jgi:SAM-dependent methyltransferase
MTSWLHDQRLNAVHRVILKRGARTVLDLGCGDGDLLNRLTIEPQIERIVGVDLCRESLALLSQRLVGLQRSADVGSFSARCWIRMRLSPDLTARFSLRQSSIFPRTGFRLSIGTEL